MNTTALLPSVERLSRCDPETDLMPKRRDDRGVRESFRMLACYVHPSVPDVGLPQALLELVANPRLTLPMAVELLTGRMGETDGWTLRRVAWAVREPGASATSVAADLGVSRDVVERVSVWVDAVAVRRQRLLSKTSYGSSKQRLHRETAATAPTPSTSPSTVPYVPATTGTDRGEPGSTGHDGQSNGQPVGGRGRDGRRTGRRVPLGACPQNVHR